MCTLRITTTPEGTAGSAVKLSTVKLREHAFEHTPFSLTSRWRVRRAANVPMFFNFFFFCLSFLIMTSLLAMNHARGPSTFTFHRQTSIKLIYIITRLLAAVSVYYVHGRIVIYLYFLRRYIMENKVQTVNLEIAKRYVQPIPTP